MNALPPPLPCLSYDSVLLVGPTIRAYSTQTLSNLPPPPRRPPAALLLTRQDIALGALDAHAIALAIRPCGRPTPPPAFSSPLPSTGTGLSAVTTGKAHRDVAAGDATLRRPPPAVAVPPTSSVTTPSSAAAAAAAASASSVSRSAPAPPEATMMLSSENHSVGEGPVSFRLGNAEAAVAAAAAAAAAAARATATTANAAVRQDEDRPNGMSFESRSKASAGESGRGGGGAEGLGGINVEEAGRWGGGEWCGGERGGWDSACSGRGDGIVRDSRQEEGSVVSRRVGEGGNRDVVVARFLLLCTVI